MHMNNRKWWKYKLCVRERECVRIYINMYDDGLERSEFKLNWTNERTIKRTNERSKERTQNGNQNYWVRVFCIDTVIHSTFLFKLVGLFVDGNVFSFDLICGLFGCCVRHTFSSFDSRSQTHSIWIPMNWMESERTPNHFPWQHWHCTFSETLISGSVYALYTCHHLLLCLLFHETSERTSKIEREREEWLRVCTI